MITGDHTKRPKAAPHALLMLSKAPQPRRHCDASLQPSSHHGPGCEKHSEWKSVGRQAGVSSDVTQLLMKKSRKTKANGSRKSFGEICRLFKSTIITIRLAMVNENGKRRIWIWTHFPTQWFLLSDDFWRQHSIFDYMILWLTISHHIISYHITSQSKSLRVRSGPRRPKTCTLYFGVFQPKGDSMGYRL